MGAKPMLIDFNKIDSMTFPGMDNGTGTMSARMYNDLRSSKGKSYVNIY
jgi:hypothetical protein